MTELSWPNETFFPLFLSSDAIHGGHFEVHFENVRVPASNIILGKRLYKWVSQFLCTSNYVLLRITLHL